MDSFLEDQLKRIEELTQRMRGIERQSAAISAEIERNREAMHWSPLQEVRDLRTVSRETRRERANDAPRRRRRRSKRS